MQRPFWPFTYGLLGWTTEIKEKKDTLLPPILSAVLWNILLADLLELIAGTGVSFAGRASIPSSTPLNFLLQLLLPHSVVHEIPEVSLTSGRWLGGTPSCQWWMSGRSTKSELSQEHKAWSFCWTTWDGRVFPQGLPNWQDQGWPCWQPYQRHLERACPGTKPDQRQQGWATERADMEHLYPAALKLELSQLCL